jgi:hypothetical protein
MLKLVRTLTLVGLGASTVALALAQGCSSSSNPSGGDAGSSGSGIVPPPQPAGAAATPSMTPENLAVHTLFLGDSDRMGVQSDSAWKAYGYNIDGKITTAQSTDVCTLAAGADKSAQIDGNGGIDNSFGENILPIVLTAAGSDAPAKINASINGGGFTIMMDIAGLTQDPMQTNVGLTGQLFAGGKFPNDAGPTWTPTDNWPVVSQLLNDGMTIASGSKIQFASAYIVNGTWVNGTPSDVVLTLSFSGQDLSITIHKAIITFDHTSPDHATNGTIAGVIQTMELVTGLKAIAGRISTSLCGGSAFDSIASQIEAASDIMQDGTNGPGQACDAISIGLGFNADHIGEPSTVAPPGCATPDPCSDAAAPPSCGGDDGGGQDGGGQDAGQDSAAE